MTGWTHKRVEPIKGSKGVLVETWSFPNKGVKVAVSTLKSAEEARRSLEGFVKDTKEAELLKGYGDEAYIWGYGGSDSSSAGVDTSSTSMLARMWKPIQIYER